MSRPAGLSDSESDDDIFFDRPPIDIHHHNLNEESVEKRNVWFDTDNNKCIEQNNKLNPTYNAERAVYLSTDCGKESVKKSPSEFRSRQASPLPFGHLRMAIIQGNFPIVESLIQKGISVDQTIKSGWTLLMVAASAAQDHILKYLLEKGANPNLHKAFFTALMAAAASEKSEDKVLRCVERLIEYNCDIDTAETHGMTALMFAAKSAKMKVLEILLKSGADVNKCDRKELTALFWAVSAGHKGTVKILLNYSADPNQVAMGQNVIDFALASGNKEMVCLLEKQCRGLLENTEWEKLSDMEQNNIVYDTKENEPWKIQEVETILTISAAESVIPIFRKHNISLTDFMHLTDKDLQDMEINEFGIRFNIMTAIKSINVEEWKKSSLPDILNKKCISLEDSISMVRNMDAHIRYMSATFGFIRKSVEKYPKLFTMERNPANAFHLTDSCFSYLKNVNGLKAEIEELRTFLKKECSSEEYTGADLIACRNNGENWKSFSILSAGVVVAFSTVVYFFRPKLFSEMISETISKNDLLVDIAK